MIYFCTFAIITLHASHMQFFIDRFELIEVRKKWSRQISVGENKFQYTVNRNMLDIYLLLAHSVEDKIHPCMERISPAYIDDTRCIHYLQDPNIVLEGILHIM